MIRRMTSTPYTVMNSTTWFVLNFLFLLTPLFLHYSNPSDRRPPAEPVQIAKHMSKYIFQPIQILLAWSK